MINDFVEVVFLRLVEKLTSLKVDKGFNHCQRYQPYQPYHLYQLYQLINLQTPNPEPNAASTVPPSLPSYRASPAKYKVLSMGSFNN